MTEPEEGTGVPIAEAAKALGVPMPTLRSWELRYQIPPSARESGRHRRYTPTELHALRLMRDEIARGKRASVAAISVRELLGLAGPAAEFVRRILVASDAMNSAEIRRELTAASELLGLGRCIDDVLLPSLRQIGSWWESGRCDVDQERLTTEAARAWLDKQSAFAPAPRSSSPVLLACGPRDLHTVGIECLSVLLRYRGWSCRVLGARTSMKTLTTAAQATGATAVVVVSHLSTGRRSAVEALQAVQDLGISAFYAGNAFSSPRSRRGLPGTYLGDKLEKACAVLEVGLSAAGPA
ncbi:MerR family transcriptional regulator [Nakamurella silvestris]|nr:MerR family transcriptional regulator [Nakamurella silvestris]